MESDLGKLFIGGISWDTNEERLRDYFRKYGEVVEAVIVKDRTTGRARGFGFVIFADPSVVEHVLMEKHTIDGRMVEAKKAIPRDDQHIINRNSSSVHRSPVPARAKKIFVGGLAATVTETAFRKYFEQFGTITDVVVMYDHNTQRSRGFGFITYDSEDAVDKVLIKTFHELNGKMAEVKKAVPKELSPGSTMRLPINRYSSLNKVNSFLNVYTQGYNSSLTNGYSARMDARFGTLPNGRNRFLPFNPISYGMDVDFETGLNPGYGGNTNYNSLAYGRVMSPYYSGNSSRYASPIIYGGSNVAVRSMSGATGHNMWGNGGLKFSTSSANSNAFFGSGSGKFGSFDINRMNWGDTSSSISAQCGANNSGFASESIGFANGNNSLDLGGINYGRINSTGAGANKIYGESSDGYDGLSADLYGGDSIYGDSTWRSASLELDGSHPFGYELGIAASDITAKSSTGYMEGYNVTNIQSNRGIAV